METLNGILERIVFENPDTGYTIGRFSARGHAELVTIVGNLASVNPGESLLLNGEWVNNPKYGRQFQIERSETIQPANIMGIRKYLGSGLIKGIGPKMAARIVGLFGMDTIDVIEQAPEKLAGVPGIGRKRVKMIQQAWEEQREIKNVMLFLQSHNVSTSHAAKIYKTYKNESISIVTANPYRLADDIYGIGFVTADTIAQKLGIDKNDPHRIQAGIKYVLSQKADDGHVFQYSNELIEACENILEQEPQTIKMGVLALTQKEEIILSRENGTVEIVAEQSKITDWLNSGSQGTITESHNEYIEICDDETGDLPNEQQSEQLSAMFESNAIYLAPFYYAEMGVANQFLRLLSNGMRNISSLDIDASLAQLENEMDIQFAPQQREAIRTALTERAMILTGGPGTGKTTTTVGMIRLFEAEGRRIVLAAPTGRAAKRLSETTGKEAKTIHRLLEFSFQDNGFKRNRENPLEADVVIVDEMSMVDLVLMNRLMQAIPLDATVILIGDIDQLPSVGAGKVLNSLIESQKIPVVRLTEIFRQAQKSMIITNAHRINNGEFPQFSGPKDRDFFFIEEEEPESVVQEITSLIADRLPYHYNFHPIDDIQLLCPMRRGTLGAENLNKCLQDVLNPNAEQAVRGWQAFRIGDKVMQIRNNYDYDVYNGDIGRIVSIDQIDKTVQVRFPEKIVVYDMADLNELVLAYATTIHKAQGSEYPAVVIPLHTQHYIMLQRNLLYTGITRAKELAVIVGTKQALGICINNTQVMWRNSYLAERLQGFENYS
ncbi:MAG: ATP-dependent RecD-like DNA helicase [Candidatus Poribacteria bacterium]|nr:ATP-dependent RecD-like DNA helicase [Candidatus Poribacteria bacterium]